MAIPDPPNGTVERLAQAAAHLKQAMLLIEEVAPGVLGDLSTMSPPGFPVRRSPLTSLRCRQGMAPLRPPIADRTTFTANWGNRTCLLGETKAFMLWSDWPAVPTTSFPAKCS